MQQLTTTMPNRSRSVLKKRDLRLKRRRKHSKRLKPVSRNKLDKLRKKGLKSRHGLRLEPVLRRKQGWKKSSV